MDPITAGATIIGGIATIVAAWQNRQKSKADLTVDTLIAAIELAETVDPESIKKLKAEIQELAEKTGVEAAQLAPAVGRLVAELRRRNLVNLPGHKADLAADVVKNARARWRTMAKVGASAMLLLGLVGCRLTTEGVVPAEGDDPAAIVIVWPDSVPNDPAYFVTEWSEQESAMVTVAPMGLAVETGY